MLIFVTVRKISPRILKYDHQKDSGNRSKIRTFRPLFQGSLSHFKGDFILRTWNNCFQLSVCDYTHQPIWGIPLHLCPLLWKECTYHIMASAALKTKCLRSSARDNFSLQTIQPNLSDNSVKTIWYYRLHWLGEPSEGACGCESEWDKKIEIPVLLLALLKVPLEMLIQQKDRTSYFSRQEDMKYDIRINDKWWCQKPPSILF